jgi:hypothetical protein
VARSPSWLIRIVKPTCMRRAIALTVIGLVALAVAAVSLSDHLHRKRLFAGRTACVGAQVRINLAKELYAQDHGLTKGAAIPEAQVWRENSSVERCSAGGHYSINPVGVFPSCSYTGTVRWGGRLWTHNDLASAKGLTNGLSR